MTRVLQGEARVEPTRSDGGLRRVPASPAAILGLSPKEVGL